DSICSHLSPADAGKVLEPGVGKSRHAYTCGGASLCRRKSSHDLARRRLDPYRTSGRRARAVATHAPPDGQGRATAKPEDQRRSSCPQGRVHCTPRRCKPPSCTCNPCSNTCKRRSCTGGEQAEEGSGTRSATARH